MGKATSAVSSSRSILSGYRKEGHSLAGYGSGFVSCRRKWFLRVRSVSSIPTRSTRSVSNSESVLFVFLTRCFCRDGKVAPVGFFDKYPALVTGFFFFMWYVRRIPWLQLTRVKLPVSLVVILILLNDYGYGYLQVLFERDI